MRNHTCKLILKPASTAMLGIRLCILVIALSFSIGGNGFSQPQKGLEYKFKAVYVFNFLQFTEWPDSAFQNERSPVILGVFGDDPFGSVLDETIQSEKVGDHPIIIKRFQATDDLAQCHALFISPSEKEIVPAVLKRVGETSTLTISDIDGFGDLGGCIGFYMEKNKLRFVINMKALKQSDLHVSSKLLRLAKIINPL